MRLGVAQPTAARADVGRARAITTVGEIQNSGSFEALLCATTGLGARGGAERLVVVVGSRACATAASMGGA